MFKNSVLARTVTEMCVSEVWMETWCRTSWSVFTTLLRRFMSM